MTAKSSESSVTDTTSTANIAKNDELLRYLHILDTLAYESLTAQLKYFEQGIRNREKPSSIIQLKWIASRKYLCFEEVKRSLLKTSDFIDIDTFEISNKNEAFKLVRRSNITLFFNLLFANFDPAVPDLQNVNVKSFLDYVVPPTMMQSERIWDLDLNLRVQIYISIIYKNPQKDLFETMFPKVVEGLPMYTETYIKVRNIIKNISGDADMLMKEFKWGKFVEDMYKTLCNITRKLDIPVLHEYTSIDTSLVSSSASSTRVVIVEDASRNGDDRLVDAERDQDTLSEMNVGNSFTTSRRDEIEQMMSHVDINDNQTVDESVTDELKQSDLLSLSDSDDEPQSPIVNRRTTRSKRDDKTNTNKRRVTISTPKPLERSSSSLTNMNVDQQSVDDGQSSSDEEEFIERTPSFEEGNSRRKRKKSNADRSDKMKRSRKNKWTDKELHALEEGMRNHGKQWTIIKRHYGDEGQVLKNRSAPQLKDKARSEHMRRQRENIDAGVFGIMDI